MGRLEVRQQVQSRDRHNEIGEPAADHRRCASLAAFFDLARPAQLGRSHLQGLGKLVQLLGGDAVDQLRLCHAQRDLTSRDLEWQHANSDLLVHRSIRQRVVSEAPHLGQCPGSSDRRVAGEWQLHRGREDPHPIVGPSGSPLGRRLNDERRLGQHHLAGDGLHLRVGHAVRVGENGERVAVQRPIGEDVDLAEF